MNINADLSSSGIFFAPYIPIIANINQKINKSTQSANMLDNANGVPCLRCGHSSRLEDEVNICNYCGLIFKNLTTSESK